MAITDVLNFFPQSDIRDDFDKNEVSGKIVTDLRCENFFVHNCHLSSTPADRQN